MDPKQEGRLLERIEYIAETVSKMHYTLHGNGVEGVVCKVNRHESLLKGYSKLVWLIAAAAITALAGAIALYLT